MREAYLFPEDHRIMWAQYAGQGVLRWMRRAPPPPAPHCQQQGPGQSQLRVQPECGAAQELSMVPRSAVHKAGTGAVRGAKAPLCCSLSVSTVVHGLAAAGMVLFVVLKPYWLRSTITYSAISCIHVYFSTSKNAASNIPQSTHHMGIWLESYNPVTVLLYSFNEYVMHFSATFDRASIFKQNYQQSSLLFALAFDSGIGIKKDNQVHLKNYSLWQWHTVYSLTETLGNTCTFKNVHQYLQKTNKQAKKLNT